MLIRQQLETVLREIGVEPLGTKDGDRFDPMVHEAIETGSAESQENETADGIVAKVLQQGYRFRGKTIRPARVAVKL
jgi:molecular chaperone GrpE